MERLARVRGPLPLRFISLAIPQRSSSGVANWDESVGMTVVRVGLSGEGMCIGDSPACLVVDRLEDVGLLGFKPLKRVGEDGKVSLLLAAVAGTEEEARGFRQCLRLDRCDDQTKIFRCQMNLLA